MGLRTNPRDEIPTGPPGERALRSLSARFPGGLSSASTGFQVGLLALALAALSGCYTRLSPPKDLTSTASGGAAVVYDVTPIYYDWYGGFGPYLSYYGYHHHLGGVPIHGPTYGQSGPAPGRDGFGRGGRDEARPSRDVVPVTPVESPRDRPADESADEAPTEKPGSLGDRGGRK